MILAGFVLGLSTRKVGETLLSYTRPKARRHHGELGGQDARSGGGWRCRLAAPHGLSRHPIQACWAHKVGKVLDKIKKAYSNAY